ncbi:MAG: porin [Rhodobacteraceae bacterium]|nr:porin [Paracoccaceae bacterium]
MKRLVLTTTSLVVAGGMAAADVEVSGSAELGVTGAKGADVKLHRDIRVKFGLSGETDTGLSFGASADFHNAGKYRADPGTEGAVHISGAFGTLTLGNTDGGFDKALSEVGSATSIADDHTGHAGYNGNSGLDGFTGNGGSILRYDYSLGGVTVSASGEFGADDSSDSTLGAGVAWSGDLGGIGIGVGIGYQTGSKEVADAETDGVTDRHKASIIGASVSADMGNGFSVTGNYSSRNEDITQNIDASGNNTTADDDEMIKIVHTGVGIAYTAGDLTVGVNAGSSTTKTALGDAGAGTDTEVKNSGTGIAVVYSLGTGVSFQVGAGSGKKGDTKESSWSAGLAFSF